MLSSIYQYGQLAYIGGGFGSGIHNILEAIVYGLPVVFGPNYKKFNEAIGCLQNGISYCYSEQKVLDELVGEFITNESKKRQVKEECKKYINSNLGSVDKILLHIQNITRN